MATPKGSSDNSIPRYSAPAGWWSIPVCTPSIGPASKPSTTASKLVKWSATSFPGQACSYMIGQLKIVELREKARKALGDKFSLREYHNVVLDTGTVPLEILERQVDAYIAAAPRRTP